MQGSARRDTSALGECPCIDCAHVYRCPRCENRGALFWHAGEGSGGNVRREAHVDPLLERDSPCFPEAVFASRAIARVFQARGTRKVEGCVGRRSRPAQRAEAKRTPEQTGRGRRDDPIGLPRAAVAPIPPKPTLSNHVTHRRKLGWHGSKFVRVFDLSSFSVERNSLLTSTIAGRLWSAPFRSGVVLGDGCPIVRVIREQHIHSTILRTSRQR